MFCYNVPGVQAAHLTGSHDVTFLSQAVKCFFFFNEPLIFKFCTGPVPPPPLPAEIHLRE